MSNMERTIKLWGSNKLCNVRRPHQLKTVNLNFMTSSGAKAIKEAQESHIMWSDALDKSHPLCE